MKTRVIHTFICIPVLILWLGIGSGIAVQAQESADSIPVRELIIFDTLDLKVHGPSNDMTFFMNGLVFLTNSKYHQKMLPDHITFGQVEAHYVPLEYIALESSRRLFNNDPFPYSPGGMSFSRDYQTLYFTRPVVISGRRTEEKIFETSVISGEVSPPRIMSFCSDPSRYMHPAISTDGSFMIFASDRVPSSGALDLFLVRRQSGGWSEPENLGPTINTSGHEKFPFLDAHNNLYFSSTGHMGFGGYDIFVCWFNGSSWDPPMNLTEAVNTTENELAFSIHPNKRLIVFTTDGESGSLPESAYTVKLNAGALLIAGVDGVKSEDISLLLQDLVRSGYTTAESGDLLAEEPDRPPVIISVEPLLSDPEEEPDETPEEAPEETPEEVPESEPEEEQVVTQPPVDDTPDVVIAAPLIAEDETEEQEEEQPVQQPEPELQPEEEQETQQVDLQPEEETEIPEEEPQEVAPDPNRLVFRVQFLSRTSANSMPEITLDGRSYQTFEYYYKGAWRITVGEFETVQEALSLRTICKSAGYSQAFVAAFRGNERELDPAVFRR